MLKYAISKSMYSRWKYPAAFSFMDYKSKRWTKKRKHILLRDGYQDQYAIRSGVRCEANIVHHILPAEEWPEYQFADWNLISVSERTHKILHEKYTGRLSSEGYALATEVAGAHGIRISTITLVIGLPGTGKTTWTRAHIGGGIAYDLDAISGAFRLQAEPTSGARRMAAALRQAWIGSASGYADRIFVIRTAPDYDELSDTNPDKVVVCTKQWTKRGYSYDEAEESQKIRDVIEWAQANKVPIEYYPS